MNKIIDYIKYNYYLLRTYNKRRLFPKYRILSIEDTIKEVVINKKSISRLGDADFILLMGIRDVSYHRLHPILTQKLREVLQANDPNFLVAITDALVDRSYMNKDSRAHWVDFVNSYGYELAQYIPNNKSYGNTHMTRVYIDSLNEMRAARYFDLLKQIWDKKNVIIVEGEYSRLGIGNDLFSNVKSLKRIIAPSKDAFWSYDEIFSHLVSFPKDTQFLFALGPTASVMCYELSKLGYWAIDIGNIDMEYMWYKAKAKEKISIRGRYHVETDNSSFEELNNEELNEYNNSILCKIGI